MYLKHLEAPTDRGSLLASPYCDGTHHRRLKNSARFVVDFEVGGERVCLVGGVVGAVTFERASRVEGEEYGRSVGLVCVSTYDSTDARRAIWGVSVSIFALNSFASSTVACECANVLPVNTSTEVYVSAVNRTSSKVCSEDCSVA